MLSLDQLNFDNQFLKLPGDPPDLPNMPRSTPGVVFAPTPATAVKDPKILLWSPEAAELLDLGPVPDPNAANILSGNQVPLGASPYATRYGGHQFGNWAGQLGDGRAINLGEVLNQKGERWEIQLKGAGPTPYSRGADGRAVLRSSLREFLCSEAQYHLGIPTTRALALVETGEGVIRDLLYDGNPRREPGAIVTRLAPTFLRFGHYQILAAQEEDALLRQLLEHTWALHFPSLKGDFEQRLTAWFEDVCVRTAGLMVEWLRVGFVHGVMNTDNMSILGLTIDYGPYGWLDGYDPNWTPNTTDQSGRYSFGQQPAVAFWNLNQLANSLAVLMQDTAPLVSALELFKTSFGATFAQMMARKLGLLNLLQGEDQALVREHVQVLSEEEVDMTLFYRGLADLVAGPEALEEVAFARFSEGIYYSATPKPEAKAHLRVWLQSYLARIRREERPKEQIQQAMNATNPAFILRNYLVQEALDELEKGGRTKMDALFQALKTPYQVNSATQAYLGRRPDWARTRPGCSALSCSS